jgi:putative hydrolase of the HAD superfamily
MIDNNIKNLIIDFGGVLIDLDRRRCLDNFTRLGLTNVEVMLDEYHQQDFFQQHEQGLISSAEFRDEVRTRIGQQVLSDQQIDDAWNSFLVGIPTYKLDLLLKLRTRYMVYLLSNTNAIHWQWACQHAFRYKGFRVEDYFEHIYLSYEMHTAKPDPAIFRQLLDETGIVPGQTLFIDDSDANCRTAEALGIHTYTPKAGEDWSHLFTAL